MIVSRKLALTLLVALSACATPPRHFDATERCGPRGLQEWDVYYDASGRLRIEIWCLQRDR